MGKGKNKQWRNNEEEQSHEDNNNSKCNDQSNGVIVLGVYLHCQGCVETVIKSLRGFDGVEEIETNMKDDRVTVKGKNADPMKVSERVRNKTGKLVELISPIPKKEESKKEEKKPEAPKVVETVLKMNLHCEGCAKDVKYCLHKMPGVQTVNADVKASRVIVKGTFDPQNLVKYTSKKTRRHVEIAVNHKNNKENDGVEKKSHEKKEKENINGKNFGSPYPTFPSDIVYAPQLFSDENPNACSLM